MPEPSETLRRAADTLSQAQDTHSLRRLLAEREIGDKLASLLDDIWAWSEEGVGHLPIGRSNAHDAFGDITNHAVTLARAILQEVREDEQHG